MNFRHFDPAQAMQLLRCDAAELSELAMCLLDHCHQACQGLELAMACEEWRGVESIAHRMRTGCAMLGASHACALAREIEEKAFARELCAEDLHRLADTLRALAIDLLGFLTQARTREACELPLAA